MSVRTEIACDGCGRTHTLDFTADGGYMTIREEHRDAGHLIVVTIDSDAEAHGWTMDGDDSKRDLCPSCSGGPAPSRVRKCCRSLPGQAHWDNCPCSS